MRDRFLPFRMALVIIATGFMGMAVGCSGSKVSTKSAPEVSRYQIRSLALIPFTSIETPQSSGYDDLFIPTPESIRRSDISIGVPLEGQPPAPKAMLVPGYAAEQVTELFWKHLRNWKGLQVIPPGEAVRASSVDTDLARLGPEKAAVAVAKRLKADAALIGLVSMYQERVGSRLGANPPATVGFQAKVIANDGKVLWAGGYYERQRPMTEDLLGFLQRWSFVTAAELAEYGVDAVLKEFPFGSGEER
ncbi:MAG: hypothetical protein KF682_15890 [Nitrospira sp.]|nr:hypothetical protein [Nitrospira sp.]